MIDVIILAAGIGSRLKPITDDIPKCMVPVNNVPLIHRIVSQLRKHSEVRSINIVLGYKSENVKECLKDLNINFILNPDFGSTNNMYSFYLAVKNIHNLDDVIIVNADCIYEDEIIEIAINSNNSCIMADEYYFNDESMKIEIENGFVKGISKSYSKTNSTFTSIDFYKLKNDSINLLFHIVNEIIESGDLNCWTEVGIDLLVKHKLVKPLFIGKYKWFEIDNYDDLKLASKLFTNV
jgi:choline kinase